MPPSSEKRRPRSCSRSEGMMYFAAAVMPPPMTMSPSIRVTAVAMASPATSPIMANERRAASLSPVRLPSAMSNMSFGSSVGSVMPESCA